MSAHTPTSRAVVPSAAGAAGAGKGDRTPRSVIAIQQAFTEKDAAEIKLAVQHWLKKKFFLELGLQAVQSAHLWKHKNRVAANTAELVHALLPRCGVADRKFLKDAIEHMGPSFGDSLVPLMQARLDELTPADERGTGSANGDRNDVSDGESEEGSEDDLGISCEDDNNDDDEEDEDEEDEDEEEEHEGEGEEGEVGEDDEAYDEEGEEDDDEDDEDDEEDLKLTKMIRPLQKKIEDQQVAITLLKEQMRELQLGTAKSFASLQSEVRAAAFQTKMIQSRIADCEENLRVVRPLPGRHQAAGILSMPGPAAASSFKFTSSSTPTSSALGKRTQPRPEAQTQAAAAAGRPVFRGVTTRDGYSDDGGARDQREPAARNRKRARLVEGEAELSSQPTLPSFLHAMGMGTLPVRLPLPSASNNFRSLAPVASLRKKKKKARVDPSLVGLSSPPPSHAHVRAPAAAAPAAAAASSVLAHQQ
jgi:hypothetical protein